MKDKSPKDESIFRKKGFFVALYSCLGVLMIIAAVLSYFNLTSMGKAVDKSNQAAKVALSELEATVKSDTESYLKKEERATTTVPPRVTTAPAATPTAKPATTPDTVKPPVSSQAPMQSQTPATQTPSQQTPAAPKASPSTSSKSVENEPFVDELVDDNDNNDDSKYAENIFSVFSEDDKMSWPVLGEIVMDYSAEHAIYDKTLDQYRTNESISIAAQVGTQVKAAADGIVRKVTSSREEGNSVEIDHGNGWTTKYSQLQDGILVEEGEVVTANQAIGGVGNPTIYSVLLGNHLDFTVEQDGNPVDPKNILE